MEFNRIRKRKKPSYTRSLLYIIVLLIVIYFWLNADDFMQKFF